MLQSLFQSTSLPVLEKVAAFAERRQEVLAGNVANISTPDYRMRDLPVADFQNALQQAAERLTVADQPASLAATPATNVPRSIDDLFPRQMFRAIEAPPAGPTFQDGNNRNIEHQMLEITKNSMLQTTAIELMSAQMNRLYAVISERP